MSFLSDVPAWQKALLAAGGVAAVGGLAWYLFREDGEETNERGVLAQLTAATKSRDATGLKEAIAAAHGERVAGAELKAAIEVLCEVDAPAKGYYKVLESAGANVGVRVGPDSNSQRTDGVVYIGEIFGVEEVAEAEEGQQYYKLADGRGWVFRQSPRDGRVLIEPSTAAEMGAMMSEHMGGMGAMGNLMGPGGGMNPEMMMQMQQEMAANPQLMQEMLADPKFQAAMSDPNFIQMMQQNAAASLASGGQR